MLCLDGHVRVLKGKGIESEPEIAFFEKMTSSMLFLARPCLFLPSKK
jgi:hypothetical protein